MTSNTPRRVQSVEIAADILESLMTSDGSKSLKEIADASRMTSAKIFPYLISLVRAGLVSKDELSGRYCPGALSRQLGVLGLHYLHPQREGEQAVRDLALHTGHGVALSVWGTHGPTVISVTEPHYSLYTEIRLGAVMSLTESSIGRTFCAWLSPEIIKHVPGGNAGDIHAFLSHDACQKIKAEHIDQQKDTPVPGISSVSVPVFDLSGAIYFVLTLFDGTSALDPEEHSPALALLRQQAVALSETLGYKKYP